MQLNIVHYTQIDSNKWNNFVYSSSMGWAYFLYEMIPFHRDKSLTNESFAIVDENDEIYFIMQLHKSSKKALESQWGFVIKDALTKKQSKLLKQTFEKYIDEYMQKHKIKKFNINVAPLSEINLPEKHNCINPTIFYNFEPSIRYTYVVNLSKKEDKIFSECEETTRQAIRKYEKNNEYTVVESSGSKEDYNIYVKLHKETYTRTGAIKDIIDDEYHKNIFYNLIPKNIAKVFFLKDNKTNEYIAQVAILIYKNTAYYWWGASKNDKEVGVNKYLLYKVILIIKKLFHDSGYFETGGAYPYLRTGKYKGLNDFKKCFGTFLHPIFTGSYLPKYKFHNINFLGIKIKYKTIDTENVNNVYSIKYLKNIFIKGVTNDRK